MNGQCANCNHQGRPDARFCDRCGAPLQSNEVPRPGVPPYGGGSPAVPWARWSDPTEGAFSLEVPRDWSVRGGIRRDGPYGLPQMVFQATDASGRVGFILAPESYQFTEPIAAGSGFLGAMMGMLGGLDMSMMGMMGSQSPPLAYQDAVSFAHAFLLPQWRRTWPDAAIVQAAPNPQETAKHLQRQHQECINRSMAMQVDGTVADVVVQYTTGGVRMARVNRVSTTRFLNPMSMAPKIWFAGVSAAAYAPFDQFATWEPVLRRIGESLDVNQQWQMAQLSHDNQRAFQMQQDTFRRQQETSRTYSETSDIVAKSYWSREQIHQQHEQGRAASAAAGPNWQQNWSNAMLGWEDRYDDTGQKHTITAGYDRVWRDDQGTYHYGNQLTNPQVGWHELKMRPE